MKLNKIELIKEIEKILDKKKPKSYSLITNEVMIVL